MIFQSKAFSCLIGQKSTPLDNWTSDLLVKNSNASMNTFMQLINIYNCSQIVVKKQSMKAEVLTYRLDALTFINQKQKPKLV